MVPAAVGAILFSLLFDAVDHIGGVLSVPFVTGTGIMVVAVLLAEFWVARGFPHKLEAAERAVRAAARAAAKGGSGREGTATGGMTGSAGEHSGAGGQYDSNLGRVGDGDVNVRDEDEEGGGGINGMDSDEYAYADV